MSGLVATWAAACCRWRNGADVEACCRAPVRGVDTSRLKHRLQNDHVGVWHRCHCPADAAVDDAAVGDHHPVSDGAGGVTACFDPMSVIAV